jgi:hypothetical protein
VRSGSALGTMPFVQERTPIRLVVMVDREVEPIRGTVVCGGRRIDFCGWLELSEAIEHARELATTTEGEPCLP